jgi:drug/metabolite transporter (DMT)-like permease
LNTSDSTSRRLEGHEPLGTKAVGLTLLTSALWGGTPVAISYSLDVLPPFAVSGLRFALATLFMLVWCRIEKTELRLRSGQVKFALVAGLLLFMQIGLFTLGIKLSNSSHATLIINTFVFWIVGLLYQGFIVAGFCFAVQTKLLKRHPASMLAVFSFMTPLFGVTLAAVFRDDNLSPWLIAAGVCVAIGIWLVNRSESINSSHGL